MPNSSKKNRGWPYWLQIICALAGMGLSVYLLVQHTRLKNGIQDGASFCSFGMWANCEAVNNSQYSEVAGVPLATVGYLFFSALLMLVLLARPGKKGFPQVQRLAAWLVASGILVDSVLFVLQIAAIHSICLVCTSTYLINFAFLFATVKMAGRESQWMSKVKAAFGKSKEPGGGVPPQNIAFATFGWLALALVVMVLPGTIVSKTAPVADGAMNEATKMAEMWDKMPTQELPVKAGDGTLGNPGAKIRIVEFSDFECPFCQRAAGILHKTLEPMKDRVHFAFKNFPLDSSCNPKLQRPMHPNACSLAYLAFCAKEKGKFWEYHDTVFGLDEAKLAGPIDALQQPLSPIFSPSEFKACLKSAAAKQNVREDIDLGIKLEVNATPTLYINGKKSFLPITDENVRMLISREESRLK